MFAHQDHRIEVATGRCPDMPVGTDVTRLETSISFVQIKSPMNLQETIRQVKHGICQSRRETVFVCLEAIAGTDNNPYSLLQVFWCGHVITKSEAIAYVTQCNLVEAI
jgi:hypothetical protein